MSNAGPSALAHDDPPGPTNGTTRPQPWPAQRPPRRLGPRARYLALSTCHHPLLPHRPPDITAVATPRAPAARGRSTGAVHQRGAATAQRLPRRVREPGELAFARLVP